MEGLSVEAWAQAEFGGAELGHVGRTARLVKMASAFAQSAGGTITSVIRLASQAKAAYRLLGRPELTHAAATAAHFELTRQAADRQPLTLLIEDTTSFNYQGLQATQGLGPIGESHTQGLWAHSCLAVALDQANDQARVLGLLGQRVWARSARPVGEEDRAARQQRPGRESERWTEAIAAAQGPPGSGRWVYVADRESDIYEVLQFCWAWGCSFVIRAAQARALSGPWPELDLLGAAAGGRPMGRVELEVGGRDKPVRLQVRSAALTLRGPRRPGGRLEDLELTVVHVREIDPPAGQEPLTWTLLTDLEVSTLKACKRVLGIYRRRWLIEEWHKALKTGLKVEASQLSDARRLGALIGILSVVAVFLLQSKLQARGPGGEEGLGPARQDDTARGVLEKLYPPGEKPTHRWLWHSIAKLGGFMGRKGDGDPGWQTIWRGWQTLMVLVRGFELANPSPKRG
jgi:hypothetical protein